MLTFYFRNTDIDKIRQFAADLGFLTLIQGRLMPDGSTLPDKYEPRDPAVCCWDEVGHIWKLTDSKDGIIDAVQVTDDSGVAYFHVNMYLDTNLAESETKKDYLTKFANEAILDATSIGNFEQEDRIKAALTGIDEILISEDPSKPIRNRM